MGLFWPIMGITVKNKTRQRKLGLLELHFPKSWIDIKFSELKILFFSVHLDSIKCGNVKMKNLVLNSSTYLNRYLLFCTLYSTVELSLLTPFPRHFLPNDSLGMIKNSMLRTNSVLYKKK